MWTLTLYYSVLFCTRSVLFNVHMYIYTYLYSAIHIVAVRKLIQWLYFSLEHFFYSEKLYLGKEGTIVLSVQPNPFTASHT